MSRVVRGGFPDREFDVVFWQEQGDEAIFNAAWDMVVLAEEFKGSNVELRADFKETLAASEPKPSQVPACRRLRSDEVHRTILYKGY